MEESEYAKRTRQAWMSMNDIVTQYELPDAAAFVAYNLCMTFPDDVDVLSITPDELWQSLWNTCFQTRCTLLRERMILCVNVAEALEMARRGRVAWSDPLIPALIPTRRLRETLAAIRESCTED